MPCYIDSGCTCHLVASLSMLKEQQPHRTTMKAAGGHPVLITHRGKARIETEHGTLILNEAYYAEGLDYSLISVPTLNSKGVKVTFKENEAYLTKEEANIPLEKIGGLWALPTHRRGEKVSALRMGRGGKAVGEIWHRCLGHLGKKQAEELAKQNAVPNEILEYNPGNCEVCNRTHAVKRPVPKRAECSGEVTVQVDYMPVGREEKGWKGEVGAYVYSLRQSKIVKTYAVRGTDAHEAVQTLRDYLTTVIPYVAEKLTCVQTDAGSQFMSKTWGDECTKHKLSSRACPVDHQQMNGQVERVIGILAKKVRALLRDHHVPVQYWPLALETASYLYNRTPHSKLRGVSPFEQAT